ncbi:hypothetical protein OIO90_000057 [Microbotryomycetes sp. JL221]|nr:hypothetical protein OIO90_000057 [Microbotryomycetes sp. JL221]
MDRASPHTSFGRRLWRATPFIVWPLLASAAWLTTILGLLLWWTVADDARRYQPDQATIAYVSDVESKFINISADKWSSGSGAAHQNLFIAGASATAAFYSITLLVGRWLRHLRRLPGTIGCAELWLAGLAIVFGFIGAVFLVLLSCFNNQAFSTAHWILALMFLIFTALSAIAEVLEIYSLSRSHPDRRHLMRNVWIKLFVISLAILGDSPESDELESNCVAHLLYSGVGKATDRDLPDNIRLPRRSNVYQSIAAVFECFLFYLLTFVLSLWPASKTSGWKLTAQNLERDRKTKNSALSEEKRGPTAVTAAASTVQSASQTDDQQVPPAVTWWHEEEATLRDQASSP